MLRMNSLQPPFLFFLISIIIVLSISVEESYAVQSGGYTTVSIDVKVGQTHLEPWYLISKIGGIHEITVIGNGTNFVNIPNEIILEAGKKYYKFEISVPNDVKPGVYVVDMTIIQKDRNFNTGGSVMIEGAKKIWHITPIFDGDKSKEKIEKKVENKVEKNKIEKKVEKIIIDEKIEEKKVVEKIKEEKKIVKEEPKIEIKEKDNKEEIKIKSKPIIESTTESVIEITILSPNKQLESGVNITEIQCFGERELHITLDKALCIYDKTFESLKDRGWIFES